MGLNFVNRNGGRVGGEVCPVMLCDVCREPVYHAPDEGREGAVIWGDRYDGPGSHPERLGPYVVHRVDCLPYARRKIEAAGYAALWDPLGRVIEQLARNVANPLKPRGKEQLVAPQPSTWGLP